MDIIRQKERGTDALFREKQALVNLSQAEYATTPRYVRSVKNCAISL